MQEKDRNCTDEKRSPINVGHLTPSLRDKGRRIRGECASVVFVASVSGNEPPEDTSNDEPFPIDFTHISPAFIDEFKSSELQPTEDGNRDNDTDNRQPNKEGEIIYALEILRVFHSVRSSLPE